jgi:Na+-translocating ferredoxin:NAD+ oxidoreductase RnfC subunit
MRAIAHFALADFDLLKMTLLCCECRVCDKYACPMDLCPGAVMGEIKRTLLAKRVKVKWTFRENGPSLEGRRIPTYRLLARLGLSGYDVDAPLSPQPLKAQKVVLPLLQHSGVPARPVVKVGERVKVGNLVAEMPEGEVGAHIHASINGLVTQINSAITIEVR